MIHSELNDFSKKDATRHAVMITTAVMNTPNYYVSNRQYVKPNPTRPPEGGRRTEFFTVCDSWGFREFLYMGSIYTRLQLVPQCGWNAALRLKAWLIPAQGNALGERAVWFLQADGLHHRLGLAWLAWHGPQDESRFQRSGLFLAAKPRALPWAGMNDAVGVSEAGPMLPKKSVLRPQKAGPIRERAGMPIRNRDFLFLRASRKQGRPLGRPLVTQLP